MRKRRRTSKTKKDESIKESAKLEQDVTVLESYEDKGKKWNFNFNKPVQRCIQINTQSRIKGDEEISIRKLLKRKMAQEKLLQRSRTRNCGQKFMKMTQ